MATVEIKFRENKFVLEAENPDQVKKLADRFNARIESLAIGVNATDLKLAVLGAIILEDEIDQIKAESLKKPNVLSENAINVLTQTIEQVAMYIDQLTDRIESQ